MNEENRFIAPLRIPTCRAPAPRKRMNGVKNSVQDGLRPGRTAGDIDVNGHDLIGPATLPEKKWSNCT